MTKSELKDIIKECMNEMIASNEITITEDTRIELVEEGLFNKLPKCPITMNDKDINSASTFKTKTTQMIKFYEENGYSEKQIGKAVLGWYYAIVGCTFGTKELKKYEPKMVYLAGLINKYPSNKATIVRDIDATIANLEKKNPASLNEIQKAWLEDIKKAKAKLA